MSRFFFNRNVLAFLTFLILIFVVMNLTKPDRPAITTGEKVLKDTLAPLQSGVMLVSNKVNNFFDSIFSFGRLKKENERLKSRVAELEKENIRLKEFEYQNLRLRDLLGYKESAGGRFDLLPAVVIARDPNNWYSIITIDKGLKDGVKKDMAVVTDKGIVGRIIRAANSSADVLLILDSSSSVGGMVQITREPGIIEGIADDANHVRMIHLPRDAAIRERQVIITSGLGGIIPKGIPVGRVTKVELESNGLLKTAVVRTFVDFDKLEELFVITSVHPSDESAKEGSN